MKAALNSASVPFSFHQVQGTDMNTGGKVPEENYQLHGLLQHLHNKPFNPNCQHLKQDEVTGEPSHRQSHFP